MLSPRKQAKRNARAGLLCRPEASSSSNAVARMQSVSHLVGLTISLSGSFTRSWIFTPSAILHRDPNGSSQSKSRQTNPGSSKLIQALPSPPKPFHAFSIRCRSLGRQKAQTSIYRIVELIESESGVAVAGVSIMVVIVAGCRHSPYSSFAISSSCRFGESLDDQSIRSLAFLPVQFLFLFIS